MKTAGAVFGEIMGFERPLYYATDRGSNSLLFDDNNNKKFILFFNNKYHLFFVAENPPQAVGEDFPLGKPVWYNYVMNEYQSCRERVGLMDMSNFSKYIVSV